MKKKISWNNIKPETQSVWGGEIERFPHGATQTPTVNSVAYGYDNLAESCSTGSTSEPNELGYILPETYCSNDTCLVAC